MYITMHHHIFLLAILRHIERTQESNTVILVIL